jgi:anaerobic ribonucleoside-triphosphate reductase activating protein
MKIKISQVINDSIVDGAGIRLAVFTQGCIHNCPACHNPQTHDINGGKETDTNKIAAIMANNPLLDGVTLTGGDPFMQAKQCAEIAKDAHGLGLNVWTYTGYTYQQLCDKNDPDFNALMDNTDVLIDGRFILEQRSLELKFRGSKNQRIIDMNKTRETGKIVELYK